MDDIRKLQAWALGGWLCFATSALIGFALYDRGNQWRTTTFAHVETLDRQAATLTEQSRLLERQAALIAQEHATTELAIRTSVNWRDTARMCISELKLR